MIWMFLVNLVRREIRSPKTNPTRDPPNATTKKETGEWRMTVSISAAGMMFLSKHQASPIPLMISTALILAPPNDTNASNTLKST